MISYTDENGELVLDSIPKGQSLIAVTTATAEIQVIRNGEIIQEGTP